ncbi:hypothetical protein BBEV_0171 [Salisediminibacterium beveridgei]|uniref:Uncharacterized protein n=1 Tax=Salisediminibacterium beveridgei TaxID=632773 RepID=A0A1D7QRE0_9BACI|nr:hypothetical protein BBEV_0171 [Salisediminibacterium beveridgei]
MSFSPPNLVTEAFYPLCSAGFRAFLLSESMFSTKVIHR